MEWTNKENHIAVIARELVPRIERGNYSASVMFWWDGVISLHFCEKSVKKAARNYQWYILTNVDSLNQVYSKIDHGNSNRTLHLRIRPKLHNSGLKIIYPSLLIVKIGRQPARTLFHLTTNCRQF